MRKSAKIFRITIPIITVLCLLACMQSKLKAEVIYAIPLSGDEHQIGNMLEWVTAYETNSQMFVVEKSIDGVSYQNIGVVDAAGQSEAEKSYRFLDINASDKKAFYRLKQIDFDGTASYSLTILINKILPNEFMVVSMSNTTTSSTFDISVDAISPGDLVYRVRTIKGSLVIEGRQKLEFGLNNVQFNLQDEKEGVYKIELQKEEELETLVINKVDDDLLKKENVASKRSSNGG